MKEEMQNSPEVIEFDVHLVNESTKIVKADKTVIKLYNNYLTYLANYVVEEEFQFEKIGDEDSDPLLKKLTEGETKEIKKLKVEDEGLLPLDKVFISRVTENQLNEPNQGTKLIYKLLIEYGGDEFSTIVFCFKNRKEQIEVYNKLINWQISKNNWQ